MVRRLLTDDSGQGMGEYALILALVAIGVILTLTNVGTAIRNKLGMVRDTLNSATAS